MIGFYQKSLKMEYFFYIVFLIILNGKLQFNKLKFFVLFFNLKYKNVNINKKFLKIT